MVSITSLRHSTRTPMSTVPGLWAMWCSAQSFSSQSAPRRPVAMTTCRARTRPGRRSFPAGARLCRPSLPAGMFSHSVSNSISTPGVLQVVLDVQIKLLGFLGAQVADRAVHQLQPGLDGAFADVLDLGPPGRCPPHGGQRRIPDRSCRYSRSAPGQNPRRSGRAARRPPGRTGTVCRPRKRLRRKTRW